MRAQSNWVGGGSALPLLAGAEIKFECLGSNYDGLLESRNSSYSTCADYSETWLYEEDLKKKGTEKHCLSQRQTFRQKKGKERVSKLEPLFC